MLKFVKNLNKLRRLKYESDALKQIADDLSVPSQHITREAAGSWALLKGIANDVDVAKTAKNGEPLVKHINRPVNEIVDHIRTGNLDEIIRAYEKVPDDIPTKRVLNTHFNNEAVKKAFRSMMESTFPDSKFGRKLWKNKLFSKRKLSKKLYDRKIDVDSKYGGFDELYRTDRKFKKLIDNLNKFAKTQKKGVVTLKGTFITVTVGFGAYALFENLTKRAKQMAGCWRIYMTPVGYGKDGTISSCKIIQCSCANPEYHRDNACTKLPKISSIGSLCGNYFDSDKDVENAECRKCDVNAPVDSLQHLSPDEMIDPSDLYVCRPRPNVGTLLSEFITDLPQQVWDGVNATGHVIIEALKYCGIFLFGCILMLIGLKCFEGYRKIREIFSGSKNVDDDDVEANNEGWSKKNI